MPDRQARWDDERLDLMLGNLLRAGVVLSALVVAAGGAVYLARHGREPVDLREFRGEPGEYRHPVAVARAAAGGGARAVIQVGLLLLIATPVARVAFSLFAFARQRDWIYTTVTTVVLGVLLFSLFYTH
jgi:uncharacterized membrane protein